jgi:hypothetical protein
MSYEIFIAFHDIAIYGHAKSNRKFQRIVGYPHKIDISNFDFFKSFINLNINCARSDMNFHISLYISHAYILVI